MEKSKKRKICKNHADMIIYTAIRTRQEETGYG